MHAAIVELDPLPDPVGSAAEDHDFLLRRGRQRRFRLVAVGRIEIRRGGGEFRRAGVHDAVGRMQADPVPRRADVALRRAQQRGELLVRKSEFLGLREQRPVGFQAGQGLRALDFRLERDDFGDLPQEPWIHAGKLRDAVDFPAAREGFAQMEEPQRAGPRHGLFQLRVRPPALDVRAPHEARAADFQRPQGFLQRLLEGTADGHRFAHRLHLRRQRVVRARELLKREARGFYDDVIQRRLEAGRRRARDVVGQLVERVADRELGRDLGDGKAGGLRGQRGAAAHARIHFDDDEAAVARVHRELHVGTAGLHADGAHDRQAGVAQRLVFAVRQRLRGRDGDAVARVHAHGIEVFDGTDDARVVLAVAHDLHLEFLPAEHRFLDQHFADGAQGEAVGADRLEILRGARDAPARAAEGEAGADDDRPRADVRLHPPRLFDRVGRARPRHGQTDFGHGLLEQPAVFRAADDVGRGADEFDLVALEDAAFLELHGQVQRRLAAHGGQERVGALAADDGGQGFFGEGFDVGPVGEPGIGHDGGGVAVDQHHLVAFLTQGLAGLGAGIIELAGLSDDDGARPDQQNLRNVVAPRHEESLLKRFTHLTT